MPLTDDTPCLYIEGETNAVDYILPDGMMAYAGITVDAYRAAHPEKNFIVLPWKEVLERCRQAAIAKFATPVREITEEEYDEMLNVLPPENWVRRNGWSVFRMCEYYTGRITSHYVSMGGRFYHTRREAGHGVYEAIIEEIRQGKIEPLSAAVPSH